MGIEQKLFARSESQYELCLATENLGIYEVQIEGRMNGQQTVILTQFIKKSG